MASELTYVRSAQVRASTLDEETRSVEAVIATEEPVLAFDTQRWEPILEVLRIDGVEHPEQVPFLDTHDRSSIRNQIGSTRSIRSEDGILIARNFYAETELGNHAWELARGGHLTDNSVGYQVLQYRDVRPGKTEEIMGRSYTAPSDRALRVTTRWRIKENSSCAIGADPSAKNRSLDDQGPKTPHGAKAMELTAAMRAWMINHSGLRKDASEEDAMTHFEALGDDEQAACRAAEGGSESVRTEPKPQNEDAAIQAARAAAVEEVQRHARVENARIEAIRTEGATHGIDAATITRCISEGHSIEQARGEFLNAIRSQQSSMVLPQIRISNVKHSTRHLEASMLLRADAADVAEKAFGEDITQQADEQFRDISLIDMTRMALQLHGHPVPHGRDDTIRAGFSTGSLSTILGNTANKMMLKGYQANTGSWRRWCNIKNLKDFKSTPMARLNDLGEFEQIGNDGEIKTGKRSETYETIKIDTYAKNFGVTRQDLINDDMGAFTAVPKGHGTKAAQSVTKLVYTTFLSNPTMTDGESLFTAATGDRLETNLRTSLALSSDNLTTALRYFMEMTGPDGEPVEVPAAFILGPPALRGLMQQLINSQVIMPVGDTDAKYPTYNPHAKGRELQDYIAEPRLGMSAYTGSSATTWYLIGDPARVDTMAVGFLNGNENPTLNTFGLDSDPNRLGITYQAYLDFGVAAADHRGMAQHTA